jgi:hypothetical protein
MAEMRASPVKSQSLKRLADIVRSVEQGGEMEFLPFNPMSLFPVSSTTLENLAYGNLPMAIPSQSNIPITKTGRKQEVAELAGLLPMVPATSRGIAQGANYLGDVMTQAVTRNPQATSMRALSEISKMSPVSQMFDPRLAKRVMPETAVVDEAGNPRLLYHGTNQDYDQFSESAVGSKTGNPTSRMGFFFSGAPDEASRYAADWGKEGGNVRPVYLDIKNPKRLTYKQMNDISMAMFDESSFLPENAWKTKEGRQAIAASKEKGVKKANQMALDLRDQLIKEGYDGAVVKIGGKDEYIAFRPDQIKSAISDPDIMEQFIKDRTDYRGLHTAPNREFGAPLHDLAAIYPDDVYSANAARFYGHGGDEVAMDRRTVQIAQSLRGKPDAEVTIYRAVPKDEKIKDINAGDWVTINKQYADLHGNSALRGNYKILERKVKAKDIYTNADSIHEYGYDPDDVMAQFLKGK